MIWRASWRASADSAQKEEPRQCGQGGRKPGLEKGCGQTTVPREERVPRKILLENECILGLAEDKGILSSQKATNLVDKKGIFLKAPMQDRGLGDHSQLVHQEKILDWDLFGKRSIRFFRPSLSLISHKQQINPVALTLKYILSLTTSRRCHHHMLAQALPVCHLDSAVAIYFSLALLLGHSPHSCQGNGLTFCHSCQNYNLTPDPSP